MSLVTDIIAIQDDILSIRDDLGAQKHLTYILKRTKSATDPELDDFNQVDPVDTIEREIIPSPWIVDYSHDKSIKETGVIKQGDLLLKMITKNAFPNRSDIDCTSSNKNETFYYYINGELYTVISVTENYTYWNVQIRKTNDQTIYLA